MSMIYIGNGYRGDHGTLLDDIKLMCLVPEWREYFENCVDVAKKVLKDSLPELERRQQKQDLSDENNITALKTESIIIHPEEESRLYHYNNTMLKFPKYKALRTAQHFDIWESFSRKA